ncbi:MAG: bifunctional (p)ppGpp synthetase/guanosine-3',5'-bis(diphosphate) 3'-pyrophosphohydrolase [Armatimonadetes bacterium]|nr:bifunctional (p)ppGpp synthetase/guanosine-3',5'-bis(diphosphate) 3'-pyrophosphohydrolase [Armatimonadota bacterium]
MQPMTRTTIEAVTQHVSGYWPGADRQLLVGAYDFAAHMHEGQKRLSGDPYITHPLEVGNILATVESDPSSVAGGLLHDTVEDTRAEIGDIEEHFGSTVARLVAGVTNLSKLDFASKQEEQARNLRKMFLAMAEDPRVILIKLSDRTHNMRTLQPLPPERQEATAKETLHIFAPLAHRLGIWRLKWELEDLSLKYLEPGKYGEIARLVGVSRTEREKLIAQATGMLEERLAHAGVPARVQGRAKHLYSIYQKMSRQHVDFSQITDLSALRVIVPTEQDCYAALGVVHELWMPIHGMFTDYIAKPKANNYQSLHTKVVGPNGQVLEIQIRTEVMHNRAEYGVAAHWRYKEGGREDARFDEQVSWVRQLLELDSDLTESHEFLELLQLDLFEDQVFVFTPKGDVIDLPANSGPLDFAYRIHTEVGNHCVGAKVNGRRVGLDYQFKNGDVAEIITSPQAEPTHNWLRIIQSSGGKSKVRRFLRSKAREDNIAAGRESLERALTRLPAHQRQDINPDHHHAVAEHLGYADFESLLAAIGFGDIETDTVVAHLLERDQRPVSLVEEAQQLSLPGTPSKTAGGPLPVRAGNVAGFYSRLSKCCNPLPGDEIVGYITRGKGLAIHRADCKNVLYRIQREPSRIVPLTWGSDDAQTTYTQDLELVAVDRTGLFSHITAIVSDSGIDIRDVEAHTLDNHLAHLHLTLAIRQRQDLDHLLERLAQLIDVVAVRQVETKGQRGTR